MEPFEQCLVGTTCAPNILSPALFRSPKDFSASVLRAINGVPNPPPVLGVAILLTIEGALLEALAISTPTNEVFILRTRNCSLIGETRSPASGDDDLARLLRGRRAQLVGFGMARIAMHVRHELNSHVRGLEITEAATPKERYLSPGAFVNKYVDPKANSFDVDTLWDALPYNSGAGSSRLENLAMRAWLTARVADSVHLQYGMGRVETADTMYLPSKYFGPIYQMLIEVEKIEAVKPRVLQNDFKDTTIDENKNLVIANDRFKNRVRASEKTQVWMIDEGNKLHLGTARRANGKLTQVATRSNLSTVPLKAIFVVGKEELSHSERARETFLLHLLQGKYDFHDSSHHLISKLYFPGPSELERSPVKITGATKIGKLNQSQADVVEAMVHSEESFVIAHGPPGTGKTSTISAAVGQWVQERDTVWVVAQSNVAVKNIAERLSKDSVRYRLLVSKEFYHEWHEDIYDDRVTESLIRTDEFPSDPREVEMIFYNVKVVLCTISTLSNPSLNDKRIFEFVPVSNLVVDEASQVGIFNYMHIFASFKRIRKVCFFGDPKQLPPYGKDAAPTVQSVFDVRHLKPRAYFLNTQYRLPVPLGQFISEYVYDGKLRSEHAVKTQSCVAFVDVSLGEEENDNKSYINKREVQTVEHLVRNYYRDQDYCIITPYDAQRNLLQKTMEGAGMRCDNIYNVDSFQGNEADFIIVSVVRSSSPGFLSSRNRVNVMLTRCKLGLVIVTSRAFMQQRNVKETLVGEMNQYWERNFGRQNTWRDWKDVVEGKAILPGVDVKGKHKSTPAETSRHRTSTRALAPVTDISGRSDDQLAPALAIKPRSSSSAKTYSYVPPQKRADVSPRMGAMPEVASITNELRKARLDEGFPELTSVESRIRSPSSRAGAPNYRAASPGAYRSSFPRTPSTSHSQLIGDAWARGPPIPSRVQPTNPFGSRVPSQKLTPLRKNVPSESLPLTKKGKRWEKLSLF